MKPVLILGLGNPLLGDEGIGVRVIEELKRLGLPDRVAAVEGGTAGLGLISLMEGYRRVIIVDAAEMGHPPGQVVSFTPGEVQFKTSERRLSLHHVGLGEALALGTALDIVPTELVIIGVQPDRIEVGAELSTAVAGAIPQIISCILDELEHSGEGLPCRTGEL